MSNKKISTKEIQHLADLARLKISNQEIKKYTKELSAILDYVTQLNSVKTDKISPTAQVIESENVFRNDLVDLDYTKQTKDRIIKNALEKQDNLFKVKTVFE
jgi:aspartyl-tRNA(Asn)/glutamyl-tRNA(Gln) amidotransferase subunit C